jgi:hypothetical protein
MSEEKKYVPPAEGHEHGYIGTVPDATPNEAYTVAGVTSEKKSPPKAAQTSAGK